MTSLLSVFRWAVLLLGIAAFWYFGRDYVSTVRDLEAARIEISAWQEKHATAVTAQQMSEQAVERLQQREKDLMDELASWRKEYEAIDRKNTEAQRRIRKLEAENATVRDFLDTHVPDELWRVLFPKTEPASGNPDRDAD